MGGLYNKLAQDWATRDGLVPQAWVDELKHSFEGMPFRGGPRCRRCSPEAWRAKVRRSCQEWEGSGRVFQECGSDTVGRGVDRPGPSGDDLRRQRVVVKAIYPEIRRYLIADLKNARKLYDSVSPCHDRREQVLISESRQDQPCLVAVTARPPSESVVARGPSRVARRSRSPGSSSCP